MMSLSQRFMHFQPVELGLTLATVGLAIALFTVESLNELTSTTRIIQVVGAMTGAMLLTLGWASKRIRLTKYGLIVVGWLWLSRAFYNIFTGDAIYGNIWSAVILNLGISIVALGAYIQIIKTDYQKEQYRE